jgi:protein-tyrosine phosphatase
VPQYKLYKKMTQYILNGARSYIYPWVYGSGSFEANEVAPKIWLGSWASAYDIEELQKKGITRILVAISDAAPLYPENFTYMVLPIDDINTCEDDRMTTYFDQAHNFIQDTLDKRESILIHCVYGVSRSATLMCAYYIRKYKIDPQTALSIIKTKRPCAQPNINFMKELTKYYNTCVERNLHAKQRGNF